jgi:hypothetical protein
MSADAISSARILSSLVLPILAPNAQPREPGGFHCTTRTFAPSVQARRNNQTDMHKRRGRPMNVGFRY